jgi:RNA polymerase sigma-32 factor
MANATNFPTTSIDAGLTNFFKEAWSYPMLGKDEEYMLAKSYAEHDDTDAAHKLVTSHLRLVAKIAMGYRGYGLPVSDLVSEGSIGLMKAVKKFDPEKGFRLSTYAIWWIRASITEYVLRSWSMVKLGTMAAQKKLFFSLRKTKSRLDILESGDLTPDQLTQLSEAMNVSEVEVNSMNRRLMARDASLNAPLSQEEDGSEFQDTLISECPSPEAITAEEQELSFRRGLLKDAMADLNDREIDIITERRLNENPMTLDELGERYGISRERIRQLEARAFEKISIAMNNAQENLENRSSSNRLNS